MKIFDKSDAAEARLAFVPDQFYTVAEIARTLRIEHATARAMIDRGEIECMYLPGNKRRVLGSAMLRYLQLGTPLYTQKQVAEKLGVSLRTIRQWMQDGILTPAKMPRGRLVRFAAEQVDAIAKGERADFTGPFRKRG